MFFGLQNTLRSLTLSPAKAALDAAHRQARRYLEAGGAADAGHRQEGEVLLPAGIDLHSLRLAIDAKLGGARLRGQKSPALRVTADGRGVVPRELIECLGGGSFERGMQFLEHRVRLMPKYSNIHLKSK